MICPCNSGKKYSLCCNRYHLDHLNPPTAEALMRSRYSAYALNKLKYIYNTWHKDTRPDLQTLSKTNEQVSLTIQTTDMGLVNHDIGTVTFTKTYKEGTQLKEHTEISYFKRENNKWMFFKSLSL